MDDFGKNSGAAFDSITHDASKTNDDMNKTIGGLTDQVINDINSQFDQAQIQSDLTTLEARLTEEVMAALRSWWDAWQTNVPEPIRWLVYGTLIGLCLYVVLSGIGFGSAGVTASTSVLFAKVVISREWLDREHCRCHSLGHW